MRRLLALRLLTLIVLVVGAALLTPRAVAGGPTSVLITDPSTGRATGLYYSHPRYAGLDAFLSEAARIDEEPSGLGSRSLILTWMLHDVQPWKTQRLYPDATGGPVLATYGSEVTGNPDAAVWSRPAQGDGLVRLLDRVLGPEAASGADTDPVSPAPAEPVLADTALADTEPVALIAPWWSLSGWRWIVPGLLLGAALMGCAHRLRGGDGGPRQILVDLTPQTAVSAPTPAVTASATPKT